MQFLFLGFIIMLTALSILDADTENPSKTVLILMGPPGSGKGTQAKMINQELGIPHVSTGDLLRENIRHNTELGKKVKVYVDAGKYVPTELIIEILFDRVEKPDALNGYLLDGFPRTIDQAEILDQKLSPNDCLVVINLDVPDDIVLKRISGRLTCPECGAVYNKYYEPPKEQSVCDKCGHKLVQRSDDDENVVKERIKIYNEQTKPVIDYYRKKGSLTEIPGEQNPKSISEQILKIAKKCPSSS